MIDDPFAIERSQEGAVDEAKPARKKHRLERAQNVKFKFRILGLWEKIIFGIIFFVCCGWRRFLLLPLKLPPPPSSSIAVKL
jgi:hypothetical protein